MDDTLTFLVVNASGLAMVCMIVWLLKQFFIAVRLVVRIIFLVEDREDASEKKIEKIG